VKAISERSLYSYLLLVCAPPLLQISHEIQLTCFCAILDLNRVYLHRNANSCGKKRRKKTALSSPTRNFSVLRRKQKEEKKKKASVFKAVVSGSIPGRVVAVPRDVL
jgi:hypothetical protein